MKKEWVEPQIESLDLGETTALKNDLTSISPVFMLLTDHWRPPVVS